MTAKATAPAREEVTCEDCDKVIEFGHGYCAQCVRDSITEAEAEAISEAEDNAEDAPGLIREWAARRHLMGQISREVREQLELCADDIEVGHG